MTKMIVLFLSTIFLVVALPARSQHSLNRIQDLTAVSEANSSYSADQTRIDQTFDDNRADNTVKSAGTILSDREIPQGIKTPADRVFAQEKLNNDSVNISNISGDIMNPEVIIPLPFSRMTKRQIIGSTSIFQGYQLEKYPSTDLRNSFTGLAAGLEVVERNGAPGLHAEEGLGSYGITQKIALYSRGGNPVFIVDDLQVDITEMNLDPDEIETVTVIRDILGKAMYGPQAADGIIYIKTKHGNASKRLIQVNAENGVSMVDRFPQWVSGGDYARLNNMARENSGMSPLYEPSDIAAYAKNDPYNLYHPSINFRNMLLKDSRSFTRVNVSAGGGSDDVQYYAYVGYNGEGDIYKLGSTADYNRINARSNIDLRITDDLKVSLGIYGGISIRRSPNYGYYTAETSSEFSLLGMNSMLDEITSIPPVAFPVFAAYNEDDDIPWYGVSSTFGSNPVGNLEGNGYHSESTRSSAANIAIDYDLSAFIPGLKSRTYATFNILNLVRLGKAENYIAYTATPSTTAGGKDTIILAKVHDGIDMADQARLHDYYYQRLAIYESLSYEKSFGGHDLQLGLTYHISNGMQDAIREPVRQQNAILSALYAFNDKYNVQGVVNYSGTSSLARDKRYRAFPSIGMSWILSEESFMENVKFVDYLKLHAQAGMLGYDGLTETYYYSDMWTNNTSGSAFGPHSANQWFGSDTDNSVYRSYPNRIANPDLAWEKRKEYSFGLDALFLKRKLFLELSYFNNLRDGIITKLTNVPYLTGIFAASPWTNFNSIKYFGLEAGLSYSNKIHKFSYVIGGNATLQNSKVLKYDEPNFREPYLFRAGQPADAYWGLTHIGKYLTDNEAQSVIQSYDESLYAGDLKYKDMNNDGTIDDNDVSSIGHTQPRLIYALNLKLCYGNFDFTAVGTGRAFYDIPLTNRYFWNGWGDNTYSKFVSENIGGAYPRLTYQKVNNNFTPSDFWLARGGFFKIQNAEIAYNLNVKNAKSVGADVIRFYARGSNLMTFSNVKEVDPESIHSGVTVYPLFRTFTGGIKITF